MTRRRSIRAAIRAERLADGGSGEGFTAWSADARDRAAFNRASRARATAIALANHPELTGLRAETAARLALSVGRATRTPWLSAAAAALAAAVALPIHLSSSDPPAPRTTAGAPTIHNTEVGQRRAVALPDGSRVTLDTASRVRIAYTVAERRLVLERGQALFQVAHGQSRPFVVVAAGREVVAHGTRFDVRLESDGVRVALIEGRVTVAMPGEAGTWMRPNQVYVADRGGARLRRDPAAVAALTSWSEGALVFRDTTLAAAVAEMNRYAAKPILLGDDVVGRTRISGSFRTGEVDAFVEALRLGFSVDAALRHDGSMVLTSQP